MAPLDLLLINPGAWAQMYGKLGASLSGIEPPLWCGLLAAFIREHGCSVKIIDAEAENWSPEHTAEKIAEHNPLLASIIVLGSNPSASSTPKMTAVSETLTALKRKAPHIKTILGGLHPSALPERTLREENVDFVCQGEGFDTILQLLNALKSGKETGAYETNGLWYIKDGKVVSNLPAPPIENLDELPLAAWDLLPMEKYRAHNWHCFEHIDQRQPYAVIYTSLGCPFNCSYCNIHALYGGKPGIRFRSPEKVAEEIDFLVKNYKIKNLKIIDELFALREDRIMRICDLIIQGGHDINIWAYARVDTVNEKMLRKMKQAGINWACYGFESASEAIESILTTWVTMGKKVKQFEGMFARYVGVPYGVMVNSGSSANLLALSILTNPTLKNRIEPGDEVITPAVTFVTTVYPIINVGAVPVLVDVDLETFNISVEEIEKAITSRTRAIMPVHLVGNPCDMKGVMEIARRHNLFVIEDACEAHGAEVDGQKVGSFGDLATFSFFFTHHISTIEGGMVMTNNEELAELARALRVFGWVRDLRDRDKIAERYQDIDPRFLFINTGYNLRPTEISGAFGMHQIKKLDEFVEIRRDNARYWTENLKQFSDYLLLPEERPGTKHVWFGYPITVRPDAPFTRKNLADFLESKGLETRPVFTGNIDEQPMMRLFNYRKVGDLPNARIVQRQSFFFGNHQGIGKEEREAVVEYFHEFMSGVKK